MAAQRTPEGPPPPPAVQKLRIQYARRGRLRYSSTRDFGRALERALRRSGVPMAYSAGFHPHPKISYANGAATGAASEAEYFEISVTELVDPDAVATALDAALPDGLDIVSVVDAQPGALADRLQASRWLLEFPGVEPADLERAVAGFMAQEHVEVERMFKKGLKSYDARGPVERAVTGVNADGCAILTMVVRHTTPAVRPDDVLSAIAAATSFAPSQSPKATRLAQGIWSSETESVADPLAAD
ncbi:MAG: TIGR03936 family radical SAM-associated protein [Janibacter sp.]|nr:TIGR03936 family radical SAM-associated protein [Janibacter sp.]